MLFLKQYIYGIYRLQGNWLYAKIMLKATTSYTRFADAGVEIDELLSPRVVLRLYVAYPWKQAGSNGYRSATVNDPLLNRYCDVVNNVNREIYNADFVRH